jgi:hypothetical protein
MGIFGFLSKAHSDQSLVSGDVQSRIAIYDEKIKTARENIEANRKQLKQMDEAVDQVMGRSTDEKGADKAVSVRKNQSRDRVALAKDIEANQKLIATLNDEAAPIRAEVRKVEAEVGPIKYIAAFIYGDNPDANVLEKAVTWVIIIIVSVFDPLAVILLLASQYSFQWFRKDKEDQEIKDWFDQGRERARQLDQEAQYEPDDGPLTEQQVEQIKENVKDELPTGATITKDSLFDDHQLKEKLISIRNDYYKTNVKTKKIKLQTEYTNLTSNSGLFDSMKTQQLKSYRPFDVGASSEFYDPELHHGIKYFDIVIGNPPYVFTRGSGFTEKFKSDIKKIYESGHGKINLFSIFIEMGLKTLNPKGVLTYIIPNTLFRATPYKPLRKLIVDNYEIKKIVDLKAGVFENVTASTTIIEVANTRPINNIIEFVNSPQELFERKVTSEIFQDKFRNAEYVFSIFMERDAESLFEKMNSGSDSLGSICSEIINGIVTPKGKDEFISTERLSDQYVPFLEGKDIDSYTIRNFNRYILFDRNKLHRPRPQYVWDAKEKLIIRRIGGGQKTLYVTYDDSNFYTFASTNVILIKENSWAHIKYILCLLNSKLLNFYYIEKFTNRSTLTVNVSKIYLSQLPMKAISLEDQEEFIELASRILMIKKNDPSADISLLESALDLKIYNLYGLTEAEIKLVEDSTSSAPIN